MGNKTNKWSQVWGMMQVLILCLLTACESGELPTPAPVPQPVPNTLPEWTILKEFTANDLQEIMQQMGQSRLNVIGSIPDYPGEVQLRAVKVKCHLVHPAGRAEVISLSGLLLLPPACDSSRLHSQLLTLPYTYILNRQAPTRQLIDYNPKQLEAFVLFGMLQAMRGYIVLLPDYPGFGDSFGQCAIPYVERRPMVLATINFIRATQQVLQVLHYRRKDELIITGYSLGAYVATQTARALETDDAKADKLTIDKLWVGGTPCDLKRIADEAKVADYLPTPYLLPLAINSYRQNGYSSLAVDRILQAPYAAQLSARFDGINSSYAQGLPSRASELFTENFIYDDTYTRDTVNKILQENSLQPWTNRCAFIMLHGATDSTVYLDNARAYADLHNASGGRVDFQVIPGNHNKAGIFYYLYLILHLPEDR